MPGALLFNAGYNGISSKPMFSSKPEKKIDTDPSYRFREKCTFNSEK